MFVSCFGEIFPFCFPGVAGGFTGSYKGSLGRYIKWVYGMHPNFQLVENVSFGRALCGRCAIF